MNQTAYLEKLDKYTCFSFNERCIRFLTGRNLIRYTAVKEWDHGYLVVNCRNHSNPEKDEEDYIDLVPILENLLIDPNTFLAPIREVQIKYD